MKLNNKYNIGDLVNYLLWDGLNFGVIESVCYKKNRNDALETWVYTIKRKGKTKEVPEHYITSKV